MSSSKSCAASAGNLRDAVFRPHRELTQPLADLPAVDTPHVSHQGGLSPVSHDTRGVGFYLTSVLTRDPGFIHKVSSTGVHPNNR